MKQAQENVIIIGSGPAGLTAAIYAARANLNPLVIAGGMAGGQLMLTTEVENFPGFSQGIMGPDLMMEMIAQAQRFGARIENVDATSVDFSGPVLTVRTDEGVHTAKSVVIATGASAKWLGIPGEERLRGRGVSSCATCDGAFFRGKTVTVVGGGDSAMEEAVFLTRFADKVIVAHRRNVFRASKIMADRVLAHPKIDILFGAVPLQINGSEKVEEIVFQIGPDTVPVQTDAVFVAIGHTPNTTVFDGQIALDEAGYVLSPDGVSTNVSGIFVAGDVFDIRYKQAITAAASGCKAAIEAEKYLEEIEQHHECGGCASCREAFAAGLPYANSWLPESA